ncbi:hypothetical protein GCM10010435_30630 [Winogradskya consettensis]|uniref:Uncharacterized protein n=1 Tax=Winogradskya consettensis TaxID=113560 RepID=A0A919VLF8_9ACTN|nr:hypothetical protein Aco04nite_20870 [Actinoplanes consettensis]
MLAQVEGALGVPPEAQGELDQAARGAGQLGEGAGDEHGAAGSGQVGPGRTGPGRTRLARVQLARVRSGVMGLGQTRGRGVELRVVKLAGEHGSQSNRPIALTK